MSKERPIPLAEKADWSKVKDTRPGCDQSAHKARSIANDSNNQHANHWKKEERKQYGG